MARKSYGRTLLELISALTILSILMAAALPTLQSTLQNIERTQTINQMISILHHARSRAVFSRSVVTLCSGATHCSGNQYWQGNLLLFLDHNANGQLDENDELLYQTRVADDFSWHWNRARGHIQFEADGTTRALNGTLTLCRNHTPQRQVVIALAGRVRNQAPGRGAGC